MRRNRDTDDSKQLVVLCPLSENISSASPEDTVCLSNRVIWLFQMHHAITTNDMIERAIFIGQVFRIALAKTDVGMVCPGLGDNRRREIKSFRVGTSTNERRCKVTRSTAYIEHPLALNVAQRGDDRRDNLVGQRCEQLVVAVCARGPSRKLCISE